MADHKENHVRTLLIGGGGFVGINVAEELLRQGRELILLSDRPVPALGLNTLDKLPGKLSVVQVDVSDSEAIGSVFERFRPDHVIHAAAITAGEEREFREFERIVDVNIRGTGNVLQGAIKAGVKRVVYVSSGSAYGETLFGAAPLSEGASLPVPDTLYSITKYASERICKRFARTHGLNVICVRLGSVFGPWERNTGVRDTFSVALQILRLAMNREEIRISPHEPRRDWIYSRDVAAGLVRILGATSPQYDLYNLSSAYQWQNFHVEWCNRLRAVIPDLKYRIVASGECPNVVFLGDRDRASMDIERLSSDTGFRPRFDQTTAFSDYVVWIRENMDFFRSADENEEGKK